MCWPLTSKKCQSLVSHALQKKTPHTHSHLELNDSIFLFCARRQRLASQIEVVPEVASGSTSSCVCSSDSAKAAGTGLVPMEQEKTRIWCHPIATQTAADSTHGKCVSVHAFKHTGREGNNPAFGPGRLNKTAEKSEKLSCRVSGRKDEKAEPLTSSSCKHLNIFTNLLGLKYRMEKKHEYVAKVL